MALSLRKQSIRNAINIVLRRLSSIDIEQQSQAIQSRILLLPAFQESSSISCYLSMPTGEARTQNIVAAIIQSEKSLFVPKIQSKDEGIMDFLRLYSASDLASLPSGMWGIKEPQETWEGGTRSCILRTPTTAQHLDMVILPGVAFDRTLLRLGHGKGYYDRFISSYVASGRPKPLLVGICLREQLLPQGEIVPHGAHDWPLDVLITPDETLVRRYEDPTPQEL